MDLYYPPNVFVLAKHGDEELDEVRVDWASQRTETRAATIAVPKTDEVLEVAEVLFL